MKMYVANTTQFDREFHYRVPGTANVRTQRIGRGQQVQMSGELTNDEIASIVEQQEHYGMFPAHGVNQAHKHIHALYAVGKPVSEVQMRLALERNLQLMTVDGELQRKAAAVGIQALMREDHPDSYLGTNISVKEVKKNGGVPDVNEEHFHRADGDYNSKGDFDTPISAPKRGRGRPRRARMN